MLHYIEPQGTGVNGSIYPRFEISYIHLFALIEAGPFTIVRINWKFKVLKFDITKFCCTLKECCINIRLHYIAQPIGDKQCVRIIITRVLQNQKTINRERVPKSRSSKQKSNNSETTQ